MPQEVRDDVYIKKPRQFVQKGKPGRLTRPILNPTLTSEAFDEFLYDDDFEAQRVVVKYALLFGQGRA